MGGLVDAVEEQDGDRQGVHPGHHRQIEQRQVAQDRRIDRAGLGVHREPGRIQQQIATMNVLRGIPPEQLNGRRLDVTPILESLVENVFGPELGSRILIDDRPTYSVPVDVENEMLINGIEAMVHQADPDMEHIQGHMAAGKQSGDPTGLIRTHIQMHMQALQKKREFAQPPPARGQPGMPGGGAPGVAGQPPRIGAQPGEQRPVQNPPGAIQQDGRG